MGIIYGLALLAFGLHPASPAVQDANKTPLPPPIGVWVKLDETLNTGYTRAGDKISATLQEDVAVKNTRIPKGGKLTGTVMKSLNQDKTHPNSGLVLLFDTAVLKDGTKIPVKVTMTSLAPSHSDEVEEVFAGSGQVTDATWRAAATMGFLDDPNESKSANSSYNINGWKTTSSIKGVTLVASPTAVSSGAILGIESRLQLTKWTRINLIVNAR